MHHEHQMFYYHHYYCYKLAGLSVSRARGYGPRVLLSSTVVMVVVVVVVVVVIEGERPINK